MDKPILSDLSFFRFPPVTGEVVRNIVLVVILMVMTILVTIVIQRWLQERHERRRERANFARLAGRYDGKRVVNDILEKLLAFSEYKDTMALVRDSMAFEQAVEHIVARHDPDDLEALALARRTFHLNVMNPNLKLVSTRQLLPDLPVRIVARVEDQLLDVYCALLRVDEEFLLLDLPQERELLDTLTEREQVQLMFWRDAEGETAFSIKLERVGTEQMTMLRARHALKTDAMAQRKDFRLTVQQPLRFTYLSARQLGQRKEKGATGEPLQGEGQLVNLSYGGASFLTTAPLEAGGIAQITFPVHQKGVRAMLEILQVDAGGDGRLLARGRFRSIPDEARGQLNNYLYREQVKRLRERQVIDTRARDGAAAADK